MNLGSIRWRLPLNYAGIALLAALALGSVMLLVLNRYYTGLERAYLMSSAVSLRPIVEYSLQNQLPEKTLQDQVNSMGFISQAQIRVLDRAGRVLADSGVPKIYQVIARTNGPDTVFFEKEVPAQDGPQTFQMLVVQAGDSGAGVSQSAPAGEAGSPVLPPLKGEVAAGGGGYVVSVSASPFGYGLVREASPESDRRSAQVIGLPLNNSLGTLEISNGPAYGSEVLRSVAVAWVISGVAATLLAGLAGWYVSRQVTNPVLALTHATHRMQQGELSARVQMPRERQQEFLALAQSFNNMAGRVEETVSTLRAFVADAAHELHTPLTALHTNLELARDEKNASARNLYLSRAQEQGQRLEALVNGLLDLSRLESGHNGEARERIDLTSLLRGLAESFASRAEQMDRTFQLSLPEEAIFMEANASQIQRAVENLLENALKFTEPGDMIDLALKNGDDDEATIRVTDNGIGIPGDDLPRLFGRFHRGHNASSLPGSGLGLAIVRAIAESHRGKVEAESGGVGQGSSFSIRLPTAK